MRPCRGISRFLLLLLMAAPAAAQMGRVSGFVREEGGQPLKGATVVAENPANGLSFTATTDDKGRFIMLGLGAGLWRFAAQAPGHAAQGGEMSVRVGSPNPPLTFSLKKHGVAAFGALGGISGKDLQDDLAKAGDLFERQQWDEAISAYRDIMNRSPTALSVIYLQIAAAHRAKNDLGAALAAYGALLKIDPDNQKALLGIAAIEMERGNEKDAEETLRRAAAQPSAGREVFFSLGEVKFTRNETSEAARWYQKAADADPSWGKPLYKLGLCAIRSGDTQGAARLMTQVIAVDPISPEAALAKSSLESLKK